LGLFGCRMCSAITITGNIGEKKIIGKTMKWADDVAVSGGEIFSSCLPETIEVDIANTNDEFHQLTAGHLPDWGIGAADPSAMRIVIKNPDYFNYGQEMGEVMRHELAHLYLQSCCPNCRWPRWFHEGCAMLFSGEWRIGRDITVARAAAFSKLPLLRELESVNNFSQSKADLSYSMSFLAVRYYIDKFGRAGLGELFEGMRSGRSFPTAFYDATGWDLGLWEADFKRYLKKRYFFIFWFGDWPVLWSAMVSFFIIIYVLKRRQMRRIKEEWEQIENIDSIDHGPTST